MATTLQILMLMLWCITSNATVITPSAVKPPSNHPNLHSEYTSLQSGNVVQLLVEGYEGEVTYVTTNRTFVPTFHYTTKELAVRELDERSDFCVALAECPGLMTDYLAYYGIRGLNGFVDICNFAAVSVSDYFTANNYQHAFSVLDGAIATLAIFIPTTVASYYMNAKFSSIKGTSTQDACGEKSPPVMAERAASAMYEFCLSIQNVEIEKAATRYDVSDSSDSDGQWGDADGIHGLSKFNIGSVEFDVLGVCHDYGIDWKRDLAAATTRGKQRLNRRMNKEGVY